MGFFILYIKPLSQIAIARAKGAETPFLRAVDVIYASILEVEVNSVCRAVMGLVEACAGIGFSKPNSRIMVGKSMFEKARG